MTSFIDKRKNYKIQFLFLTLILFCLIIISSTLGAADISFFDVIRILLSKVPILNRFIYIKDIDETSMLIILKIRLPRILLAGLIGIGLSIVGVTFQGLFKNPMADPYVLGVSSGSALGASIAIVLGFDYSLLGMGAISLMAFVGSITTAVIVYSIAKVENKIHSITLLLSGIALSFLLSSIISLIMTFNRDDVEKIVFWTMGSVSAASLNQVIFLFPIIAAGIIIITIFSRDLNIILTGEDTAKSLGVEVETIKKILLVTCSIITAACVSVSGIIGFVGLIVPHIMRLIIGSDNRVLVPLCALGGAIFMIVCETLSVTLLSPTEIPIGIITSILGAPYFLYLLNKSKKKVL
ncbi:MAG: iron chelate uptake ABC transporter family permease subunit [Clostridium sp.]|nr:iron chelate uptake ABC transporter family permease subunit [Clostridium sp.]